MPKLTLILVLLLLPGQPLAAQEPAAEVSSKKPNVLFVIIDDLNTALGCYDDPDAHTPNLDRLAARSVLFERAYCQYPLCGPSRASFLTGLRPDTAQVLTNGHDYRQTVPGAVTLPAFFRRHGYDTGRVGSKVFHFAFHGRTAGQGMDDPAAWDETTDPRGRDLREEEQSINYIPGRQLGGTLAWMSADGTDAEQTDGLAATDAIQFLRTRARGLSSQPFFLAVGLYRPHVPCIAPHHHFSLHPLENIRLPGESPDHLRDLPEAALPVTPPNYGIPDDKLRRFKRAYYASVTFVDAQLGRILDALDELGLEKDTIIVAFGDHGWLLGQHGQWQKASLWEEAARVPLLISVPQSPAKGKRSPRTVELVDLYPTLADLCGLTPPASLEGTTLRPLLENPELPWTRPAFTQVRTRLASPTRTVTGRSVRTERWRYTEWDEGAAGAQLYDHASDPGETKNLVHDSRHAETVTRLCALLHENGE